MLFSIYLMFNGIERFLIEKIRVNNVFDFLGMQVTQAEVISTLMFLAGLSLLLYFRRSYAKSTV
jgi:phosphatidylglycerol:prolipoprotein diacylglycerol transferase